MLFFIASAIESQDFWQKKNSKGVSSSGRLKDLHLIPIGHGGYLRRRSNPRVLPLGLGSATGAPDGGGTAGVGVVVREVHHLLGFLALAEAKVRGFLACEK